MSGDVWSVAGAKAHLSEVIDRAVSEGPQTITRRGRAAVVVVSAAEWDRRARRHGTLVEFFARSPLRGSAIKLDRLKGPLRKVDL